MRKYTLNEDFFENIDSEEKAYWLGFITADGCINKNRHGNYIYLSLALNSKDRSHLEKWAKAVGYNGPVCDYAGYNKTGTVNEYSKIVLSSRKLTDDLRKLGVTERKSLIAEPADISSRLWPHYIRGLLDGDGGIYSYPGQAPQLRFSGSKSMVEFFADFAASVTGTNANIRPIKSIYQLAINGTKKVGRMLDILYVDSCVALDRKQNIAHSILGQYMRIEGVT